MIFRNFPSFLAILFVLIYQPFVHGQGRNEEVTIIAPYIPTIGTAAKIPFRPEITVPEATASVFEYDYITKSVETRLELDAVDPVRFSDSRHEDLPGNYAKVGFGNYWTPYVEFLASNLQSEKYLAGVRLRHHSSQGGGIKGYGPNNFSHNLASVYGKTFLKDHTLSGNLTYNRDVVHFYGFPVDNFPDMEVNKEDIRQRFQHVRALIDFGSNYTTDYKLDHQFQLEYDYFSDFYQTRESHIAFLTSLNKGFDTRRRDFDHSFGLDVKLDYLNYKDTLSEFKPLYIEFAPVYTLSIGQYSFKAGFNADIVSEPTPQGNGLTVGVFPLLGAEIVILEDKVKVFADLFGNLIVNSFRQFAYQNPFIVSTPELRSTGDNVRIQGGITGNAGGLNYLAQATYAHIGDMPLFVTDPSLALDNRFMVIYDDINLLNVKATLGYTRIDNFLSRITAAYYVYIPKNEEKAWHMPSFEVSLDAAYRLKERYHFRTSMLLLGSRYARTFESETLVPVKMGTAFDLSVGFEYRINRMISAFIDGNNLLNQSYQRWYNYPVQGIQVMLGAKISF